MQIFDTEMVVTLTSKVKYFLADACKEKVIVACCAILKEAADQGLDISSTLLAEFIFSNNEGEELPTMMIISVEEKLVDVCTLAQYQQAERYEALAAKAALN